MPTFITRLDATGTGPRLAVKDLIDVRGVPTTAGSEAVAGQAGPAAADAACLAGARAAGAVIVGKANLVELAYGASGINPYFGTPVNPLDPALLPGGSSSGSAVAVAAGEADVAYGSDTGGSIRVPAAYCGVAGLKTTHGRVSLDGVWPLAPSLDTVGPMARDVAGLIAGMALLEPGFAAAPAPAVALGRLRPAGVRVDPAIDAAVDEAVRRAGIAVTGVSLDGSWRAALDAAYAVLDREAAASNAALMADPDRRAKIGADVRARLADAAQVTAEQAAAGRAFQRGWQAAFARLFRSVQLLVLPAAPMFAPPLAEGVRHHHTRLAAPVNLAGLPALALPVPAGRLPASIQLIGPAGGEELLLATGAVIEAACA